MSTEPPQANPGNLLSTKRIIVRPWFIAAVTGLAAFVLWIVWPSGPPLQAAELSRADGKSRFWATTYSTQPDDPNLSLDKRLVRRFALYKHRRIVHANPAIMSFAAHPVQPSSINSLLNQCMEITGTRYLVAVEIMGTVEFGHTNSLNGVQWVAAFENVIETSKPVLCYDYGKKTNFEDTLLLIRDRPGVVKVVPRTKLADYEKLGLVKSPAR